MLARIIDKLTSALKRRALDRTHKWVFDQCIACRCASRSSLAHEKCQALRAPGDLVYASIMIISIEEPLPCDRDYGMLAGIMTVSGAFYGQDAAYAYA